MIWKEHVGVEYKIWVQPTIIHPQIIWIMIIA